MLRRGLLEAEIAFQESLQNHCQGKISKHIYVQESCHGTIYLKWEAAGTRFK